MTLAIKWLLSMIFMLAKDDIWSHGKNTDCTTASFTITSGRYGHVHHVGISGNLDLLEFSKTQTPAYFCFTNSLSLKELESGKCVATITDTNLQLVLTNTCKRPWRYNPDNENLIDTKSGHCFSTWIYSKPPPEVQFVPGLSQCTEWSRMVLNPLPAKRTTSTTTKSINTEPFTRSVMHSTKEVSLAITKRSLKMNTTKDQSSDTNSNTMSISTTLYIILPTVPLALIIVVIFLVRKNRAADKKSSEEENNRETENQHNNDQSMAESDVYEELDQNRDPDNTYMSLVHYENPDEGRDRVPPFVFRENVNYINESLITEPRTSSTSGLDYVIPGTN